MPQRYISTPADLAEYFREVEEYINGNDPHQVLMRRLSERVEANGLQALSEAEQCYFAVSDLYAAIVNGLTWSFLVNSEASVHHAVARGFTAIGESPLADAYRSLAADPGDREWDEELAREDVFIDRQLEVQDALDRWAQEQGLLPA